MAGNYVEVEINSTVHPDDFLLFRIDRPIDTAVVFGDDCPYMEYVLFLKFGKYGLDLRDRKTDPESHRIPKTRV